MYFNDAARLLDEAERLVLRNDRKGLERVVHGLKSSTGYLGAYRLRDLCADFETRCKDVHVDCRERVAEIRAASEMVYAGLQQFVAVLPTASS